MAVTGEFIGLVPVKSTVSKESTWLVVMTRISAVNLTATEAPEPLGVEHAIAVSEDHIVDSDAVEPIRSRRVLSKYPKFTAAMEKIRPSVKGVFVGIILELLCPTIKLGMAYEKESESSDRESLTVIDMTLFHGGNTNPLQTSDSSSFHSDLTLHPVNGPSASGRYPSLFGMLVAPLQQ